MSDVDIVWWSIDSVRRDRCSAYGYARRTTPTLTGVGRQFNGRAHGTWTLPSVTSMFSLRTPSEHGITEQGAQLREDSETVPQRLREAGYHTVGLAANPWVSRGSGLDIGFEEFYNIDEDENLLRAVGLRRALQFAVNVRSLGGGFTLDSLEHPTDWLMLSLARQRLIGAPDDRPTFMYLHTKGCHSVREDFRPPPAWNGSVSPGETVEDRYDDLLAWVDHLWPLLGGAVDDDTVVIVTSDHGELLGEDGLFGHGHDHDLLYDVPLWVRGIDATWSADTVSHIDVMREILDEVGAPSDPCGVSRSDTDEVSEPTQKRLEALGYR